MSKPVIYGFGPLDNHPPNPSQQLVEKLINPYGYEGEVLPTSYARAAETLGRSALFETADLVVLFSYSPQVKRFRIDRVARNGTFSRQPDVDGRVLAGPIDKSLPKRLVSPIDAVGLAVQLQKQARLVDITDSPTDYVYNHTYFTALAEQRQRETPQQTLLVQVPANREQANVEDALKLLKTLEVLPPNGFVNLHLASEER